MNTLQLQPELNKLTIEDILERVSFVFTVRPHRITGNFYGEAGDARKASVMALRQFSPNVTFNKIGELMGRDYSTIIHLNYRAQDLLFSDKQFKAKYNHLIQELEALQNNETHAA